MLPIISTSHVHHLGSSHATSGDSRLCWARVFLQCGSHAWLSLSLLSLLCHLVLGAACCLDPCRHQMPAGLHLYVFVLAEPLRVRPAGRFVWVSRLLSSERGRWGRFRLHACGVISCASSISSISMHCVRCDASACSCACCPVVGACAARASAACIESWAPAAAAA